MPDPQGLSKSPPGARAAHTPSSFGELLRRYRQDAGLTQELLAARAGLSARAIQGLETGGGHVPRPATVHQLVTALGLGAEDQALLMAAVQGSATGVTGADPPVPRDHATARLKLRPGTDPPVTPASPANVLGSVPLTFGKLLRHYRLAAGQTQAQLADLAGLSMRAVQDLEREVNWVPRAATAHRLAAALRLGPGDAALLEAAGGAGGHLVARTRHNLPVPPTLFIGRDQEVAAIHMRLGQGDARLLTLTGPPGIGKTRLALAAAGSLLAVFPDGVAFVPLAAITDPIQMPAAIAAALSLPTAPGRAVQDRLTDYLRDKQLLLVLDNFEQLLSEWTLVRDLLAAAPRLRVLITSRARLGVAGEEQIAVPALALPPAGAASTPEQLAGVETVALFVARARTVQPGFRLTVANAPAVAAICRRLEGVPLALELAAAQCATLTPQKLIQHLAQRLPVLTAGLRDLPDRQRTLRGAIAWSYALLSSTEQYLFRTLGVFAGGWTLAGVEAVAVPPDPGPAGESAALSATLDSLIDKSLVTHAEGPDGPRFGMYETLREFAREQLALADEEAAAQERHLAYFLALGAAATPYLISAAQVVWLDRLAADHDNLRAALEWTIREGRIDTGLQLAIALWPFWRLRGHVREGQTWLGTLLKHHSTSSRSRAAALHAAASLAYLMQDRPAARAAWDESLALCRALDDQQGMAEALNGLGLIAAGEDIAAARGLHEESVQLFQECGDLWGSARAHYNLGLLAERTGNFTAARRLYIDAVAQARAIGDQRLIALILLNIGNILLDEGDLAAARDHYAECLRLSQAIGDQKGSANALNNLGNAALYAGDYAGARRHCGVALAIIETLGEQLAAASLLIVLGDVARLQGDFDKAAACYIQSRVYHEAAHNLHGMAWICHKRAVLAWQRGDLEQAALLARESLTRFHQISYPLGLAHALVFQATVAVERRQARHATRLLGAADALLARIHQHVEPPDQITYTHAYAGGQAQLAPDVWALAYVEGLALAPEQAVAETLAAYTGMSSTEGTLAGS